MKNLYNIFISNKDYALRIFSVYYAILFIYIIMKECFMAFLSVFLCVIVIGFIC